MKKVIAGLLVLVMALSCSVTAFAAESTDNDTQVEIGVYAKAEYNVEGVHPAPVTDDTAEVTTDDGTTVTVTEAPEGSVRLMVVPIPETEKEAWEWIESSLKDTADPVHTFDIYFEDQNGKRMDADGAVVTVTCPHCDGIPVVCSLDKDGTVKVLTASPSEGADVTFTTNGSPYYVMAKELPKHDVEIKDTPGGEVVIDNPTPEAGDDVTITPDPDDGKVVDQVVVKDEDGNEIPVIDNGDGTYTYEQPDGDVTIEVTFKDEKTPDSPQTGDNSQLWLWWLLLIVSATGVVILWNEQRKRKAVK